VKQTTTGFRGPLMVQSLTSAKSKFLSLPSLLILPKNTVKTLPLTYNIYEVYKDILENRTTHLNKTYPTYNINIEHEFNSVDEWCRDIVWYKNKPGNYLYGANNHKESI